MRAAATPVAAQRAAAEDEQMRSQHGCGRIASETGAVRLFEGVDEALRSLSAHGVRLTIVTSNALENLRQAVGGETIHRIEHVETRASLLGKRRR